MVHRTLWAQRLVALFDGGGEVFGIPRLFAYLFGAWALLIVSMILVIERSKR